MFTGRNIQYCEAIVKTEFSLNQSRNLRQSQLKAQQDFVMLEKLVVKFRMKIQRPRI